MDFTANDPRVIVTSGGTFCLVDEGGRLVGTITRPVARVPVGGGQGKVYLARPNDSKAPAAA